MTQGGKFHNAAGVVSIDAYIRSYVYIGKAAIPLGPDVTVTFSCVGYPIVYFDLPYNTADRDSAAPTTLQSYFQRSGISMSKLRSVGTNQWQATFSCMMPDGTYYMRWFGRLDLNFPNGAGTRGCRIRIPGTTTLVFESNLKMHRLAGDTYSTEIALTNQVPGQGGPVGDRNDKYDVSVALPFSLSAKSICANSNGTLEMPYATGHYIDVENVGWTEYQTGKFQTLYWANGNTLVARRIAVGNNYFDRQDSFLLIANPNNTTYTRLAVIDNSKFP